MWRRIGAAGRSVEPRAILLQVHDQVGSSCRQDPFKAMRARIVAKTPKSKRRMHRAAIAEPDDEVHHVITKACSSLWAASTEPLGEPSDPTADHRACSNPLPRSRGVRGKKPRH
jgi:hypothetical protein